MRSVNCIMQSSIGTLCVLCSIFIVNGSLIVLPSPLPLKRTLPVDVISLIAADYCDNPTLSALSMAADVLYTDSKPLLVLRKQQASNRGVDNLTFRLTGIVSKYRRNERLIPTFDSRNEVVHYLNGFHGHIDWLTTYLDSETVDHDDCSGKMICFKMELGRYRYRYLSAVPPLPLHFQHSVESLLFDEYITLRDESEGVLESINGGKLWDNTKWRDIALWKLMMEQIGVMIGYPTLKQMEWNTENDDLTPKQWIADIQEVHDFAFCVMSERDQLDEFSWFRSLYRDEKIKQFVMKLTDFVQRRIG